MPVITLHVIDDAQFTKNGAKIAYPLLIIKLIELYCEKLYNVREKTYLMAVQ